MHAVEETESDWMRSLITASDVLAVATQSWRLANVYSALLYHGHKNPRELPSPFVGPLDGKDSRDEPWVTFPNLMQVKGKLGLIKRPPPGAPGGPPPAPGAAPGNIPNSPQP